MVLPCPLFIFSFLLLYVLIALAAAIVGLDDNNLADFPLLVLPNPSQLCYAPPLLFRWRSLSERESSEIPFR
jgi:hypothetical protein